MPNEGISPPDYTTTVGQFRALIGDTDAINVVSGSGEYVWFGDAEINAFLAIYDSNPKAAAARALLTIAGSQALLLKKWSSDDLSVDGAAIAEALRKQAKDLQEEVAAGLANTDIFEISYPGSNSDLIPELLPAQLGSRWARNSDGEWVLIGAIDYGYTITPDGYVIDG